MAPAAPSIASFSHRQRHGRRRHHQCQYADAHRHGGSQQHGQGLSTAPRCSAAPPPMAAAPGATPPAALAQWRPQPHRDGDRCRRQYQCGLGRTERDHRYDRAGCPEHRLVLARQRHGRRRHHQCQYADAHRHGGSQQTVKVYDGATLLGSATANGSGAWSYTTAALANGAHSLTATATDAAGNISTASAALAVTIDTTARLPRALPRSRPTAARLATTSPMTTR